MRTARTLGAVLASLGTAVAAFASTPIDLTFSNITDSSFTVSWATTAAETGEVHYGTTPSLGSTAADVRGGGTSSTTHYVVVTGMAPGATCYCDIVSGGTTYDNGGSHYTVVLAQPLVLPTGGPQQVYGRVYGEDGTTPAAGAVVLVRISDSDGAGTPGQSQYLSALADGDGWWTVNIGWRRAADNSAPYLYSETADTVTAVARDGDLAASTSALTSAVQPVPPMTLAPAAMGDIDGNGSVTIADVIRALRMVMGLEPVHLAVADVNRDLVVNIADVILILRLTLGLS